MRRAVTLALLLPLLLGACGTTAGTQRAVSTYEAVGLSLSATYAELRALEASGVLQGPNLEKARRIYNQARQVYIRSGDLFILALEAPTKTERNQRMNQYTQAMGQITLALLDLAEILKGVTK